MSFWGPVVGGLVGGIAGMFGQREANEANVDIAERGNQINMLEAQRNRDFQREMSNTAHTRQVEDLKRAGLNPILSAMSGASTPSGAQGTAMGTRVENELEGFRTTAREILDMQQMEAQTKLLEKQTQKTSTEEKVLRRGIPESEIKNDVFDLIRPYLKKAKQAVQSNTDPKNWKKQPYAPQMKGKP